MARLWCKKRLRRILTAFILQGTVLLSIALGVLPFKYNITQRRLEKSRLITCYSIVVNALVLGTVVASYKNKANVTEIDFLDKKPLNAFLILLETWFCVLMLLVTFYKSWTTREELLSTFKEIGALDREQTGTSIHKCELFQRYVIWKLFSTLLQILSPAHYSKLATHKPLSVWLLTLFMGCIQLIFFAVWNQFFLAVLFIYRNLWSINRQLSRFLNKIGGLSSKKGERHDSYPLNITNQIRDELDCITSVYMRLVRVCEQLTALYEYQLIFLFGTYICVNVLNVFYFLVIYCDKAMRVNYENLFMFTQGTLINLLDFWLDITICELTLQTAKETRLILRSFNGLYKVERSLQDSLDFFGLMCCCNKFRFSLCGLFDVNHRSGCMMLVTTMAYLLCLVQFDFMNL